MRLILLTTLLSVWLLPYSFSQPVKRSYARSFTARIERWDVIDIEFSQATSTDANSFRETFDAEFTGPSKQRRTVRGFYNGNNQFVIRFSESIEGTWTFSTISSVSKLSGLKGTIEITPSKNKDHHGAVTVRSNAPQKFVYEDSSSYFSLAFELDWLFALDYDNKTDIPKTRNIISQIKKNGFNQIVMNVYAYDVGWKTDESVPPKYEYRRPKFSPFVGTNESPDFSKLNVEFFKHFDRVISYLHQQGIVAHVMIYVWNKKVSWPSMYSEADNQYFDYVISRYQAFSNIVWDVSKEALDYGRCDIPYINERISRIRRLDDYNRLVTVHDYEYCSREPDRIDFISIQSWRSDLYSRMIEAVSLHADKPVVNIEHGGYEAGPYKSFYGNYTDPETCLIRNYQCIFAGVYPSYYWQNTSWNIVVDDPFDNKDIKPAPRFEYYKHMASLFARWDFNSLIPNKPKITTNSRLGNDNLSTNGYFLTNDKNLYLYLIPSESESTNLVLPKSTGAKMKITWFNPFTGEFQEKGETDYHPFKELRSPWGRTYSVAIVEAP